MHRQTDKDRESGKKRQCKIERDKKDRDIGKERQTKQTNKDRDSAKRCNVKKT
jgi:hypothetical protein